ncbi:MAG: multidrug efflux pump [Patiriisocius sp.]|jgi:multidrug efflux pump
MNALVDAAVGRTRTTLLIMLMVLIAGSFSLRAISVESDPYIAIPIYVISVFHEGISPEDGERLLIMPLETELRSVEGVEEITSYASENYVSVVVEFGVDHDLQEALLDVREAVDRAKPELPSTAEEPVISEETTADYPILQINLIGDQVSERSLYEHAVKLRNQIESLPEVMDAELQGDREELLEAVIDPMALEAYSISSEELIGTIVRNNRLIPAGNIDTGEGRFSVKVPSVIENARDLFDLPIKTNAGTVVTLSDVATIKRTFKDRNGFARVNGQRTISINVIKRAQANIIETVDKSKRIVEDYRPLLPNKVEVFYTQDQAPFAESQVRELQGNIMTALALVMVLIVAAMGFRSGIIVGFGIPVSFLFAVTLLHQIGFTYNFMVMFGMLLALGMLIDGAIVVTEYADRKMVEGFHRREAYAMAAKRMFWPVVASVATTLAAFLPLMFWPGIPGKFMRYLPVTVFTVLIGSLLYALVFGPALGAVFGKAGEEDQKSIDTLKELEEGDPTKLKNITGAYARLLLWTSHHAGIILILTLGVLYGSFTAYGHAGNGIVFFSNAEPKFGRVTVRARGNLSAVEANDFVKEVEEFILGVEGISAMNTWTKTPGGASRGSADRVGTIFLELMDENEREATGTEIFEAIRERTKNIVGIGIEIEAMEQGPSSGKPIAIQFASQNKELLDPAIDRVIAFMSRLEGLRDVDDTRALPGIEWRLTVDRAQAALFGADVSQVGVAVQLLTNGVKVGEYRPDGADDAVDIRVRFPESERGINALDELKITTQDGLVPISNFVTRAAMPNVDSIQRIDGVPVKFIQSDVAPGILADNKVKEISAWLETQRFDPRLDITFRGVNEEQADSIAFVGVAFSLSLLLMFVLLVTQFNSLYQAVLILFAVVMSTAGVLIGLIITGNPFSAILTGTGIVALAGIVVNNNIVLIDTFNHIRRQHPELSYDQLIVRTGAQRLRPVVLTTVTTICGMLPLAMNFSVDLINRSIVYGGALSNFWVPLSQAIVSGLAFASILTLITTPAMLALPYRMRHFWDMALHWARPYLPQSLSRRLTSEPR